MSTALQEQSLSADGSVTESTAAAGEVLSYSYN